MNPRTFIPACIALFAVGVLLVWGLSGGDKQGDYVDAPQPEQVHQSSEGVAVDRDTAQQRPQPRTHSLAPSVAPDQTTQVSTPQTPQVVAPQLPVNAADLPEVVYIDPSAMGSMPRTHTTLPMPVARMVHEAEELERQELLPDDQGRPGRVRLLRSEGFKYPHLRVEERFSPQGNGRFAAVPEVLVSVASHVMIQVDRDVSNADLETSLAEVNGRLLQRHPHSRVALVEVPEVHAQAVPEMIAALNGRPLIRSAEQDYVVGALTDPDPIEPNDPDWDKLWGLPKIQAGEAWNVSRGSRDVVVAVIDTGIDYTHPDLIGNMYYNPNETANGSDSDGNGFRDDIRGWNFVSNNNNPMDDQGHGTHCAGTIGAMGNNGVGITGVVWNVQLMALKFLDHRGSGTFSDAVASIEYATLMGVDMTNNSWGGGGFSRALYDVIDEARQAGILFLAAAGNSGGDMPGYPARYGHPNPGENLPALDNVISVGASDINDNLANFSNRTAHIAAPGVNIFSTEPLDQYGFKSGTSMACPHVAGAAALALSVRPELSYLEVRDWLINSADTVPTLNNLVIGNRRLNVFQMLSQNLEGAFVVYRDSVMTDSNGNGIIEAGESVDLLVTLTAAGNDPASNVSATLSSNSPHVTITQNTASYGNIALWQAVEGNQPYTFTVAEGIETPYTFTLNLTISADGVAPRSDEITLAAYTAFEVTGTVRTLLGQPFPDAQVSFSGPTAGSVSTAGDGSYSLTVVDGSYTLEATAAGYQRVTRLLLVEHDSDPANFENVDFVLGNRTLETDRAELTATTKPGGKVEVELELRNEGNLQLTWNLHELTYTYEYLADGLTQDDRPDLHWRAPRNEHGALNPGVEFFAYDQMWGWMDTNEWWFAEDWHLRRNRQAFGYNPTFVLDFDFPFYEDRFNSLQVDRTGWMSFARAAREGLTFPQLDDPMPTPNEHGNKIAFAWISLGWGRSYNIPGAYKDAPFDTVLHSWFEVPSEFSSGWDIDDENLTGPPDLYQSYTHRNPHTWTFTFNRWTRQYMGADQWEEPITGQVELRADGTVILRYKDFETIGNRPFNFEEYPLMAAGMQNGSGTRGMQPIHGNHRHLPIPGSVLIMRPTIGAHWLKADRDTGSVNPITGTQTIRFTFDAEQLGPGEYTTTVIVESNESVGNGRREIPVTFTVSDSSSKMVMTSPDDNQEADPGETITLTASLDGAGSISAVTFLRGEEVLAEDVPATGNEASFVWENIPGGRHAISARAVRNDGSIQRSQPHHLNAGPGLMVEFEGSEDQSSPTAISRNSVRATRYDGTPIIFSDPDAIVDWGSSEDPVDKNKALVLPNTSGTDLRIDMQAFIQMLLPSEYEVTENTVIEGQIRSFRLSEYHDTPNTYAVVGLGLHDGNNRDLRRIFQLMGNRTDKGTIQAYNNLIGNLYDKSTAPWQSFRIPIGQHYTGSMDRVVFVQANWAGHMLRNWRRDQSCQFRNLRIFEDDGEGISYEWSFNDSARADTGQRVTRTFFTPGDREIEVTARSGAYEATARRLVPIAGEEQYHLRVNFRYEHGLDLANYLSDRGAPYGNRGKDVDFGWNTDQTSNMHWLNLARVPGGSWWEAEVPNGYYDVTVRAVGVSHAEGGGLTKQTDIRINGMEIINHPIPAWGEIVRTITVPVEEGRLRMSVHGGRARIDYIEALRVDNVLHPPEAFFTISGQSDEAPFEVSFDASASYDVDGHIVSYEWDFGDYYTGIGVTPSHIYLATGSYVVTLTVTDNDGLTGTMTQTIYVGGVEQPAVMVVPPPAPRELHEDGGELVYTIRLNTQPSSNVTVTVGVGDRIMATPNPLIFSPENWDIPQTVTLTAIDDEIVNGTTVETVTATASSGDADYQGLTGAPFNVTVYDNDAYGTVQFTESAITVHEDVGTVSLTLSRINGQSGTLTAHFTTVDGTATGGDDFERKSGSITWEHNDTDDKTIEIVIIDDDEPEPTEHFQVQITSAVNQYDEDVLGSPSAVTITIIDNDSVEPSVVLHLPEDEASFEAGDNVTFRVMASSPTSTIAALELKVNGIVVGTASSPVEGDYYEFNWIATIGSSSWSVRAIDADDYDAESDSRSLTVTPIPAGDGTGFLREVFNDIPGNNVSDLTGHEQYPDWPESFDFISSGSMSYANNADNYGTRLRAYFVAPKTGDYHFYMSARRRAEVWLSSDESPGNAVRILNPNREDNPDSWGNAAQRSAAIPLVGGQRYYLEALQKAATSGTRHIQVGVELPGEQLERPIPVHRLQPFNGIKLRLSQDLVLVPEGGWAEFSFTLSHQPLEEQIAVTVEAKEYVDGGDSITVDPESQHWSIHPGDWDRNYSVILHAAEDEDALNGERTIRLTLANGLYWELTAREIDAQINHPPEVEIISPTVSTVNMLSKDYGLMLRAEGVDIDGDDLTYLWEKSSGPGTVTFDDPSADFTGAMFSEDGEYVLRVTVDDGRGETASDEVTVSINQPAWHFESIGPTVEDSSFSIDGDGKWLLSGRGTGFHATTTDDFQFAYIEVEGDFEYKAQLTAHNSTGWHYTGIMARDNLTQGSPFLAYRFEFESNGNLGLASQAYRRDSQGATSGGSVSGSSAPGSNRWLHVRRIGNQFGVAHSASGTASSWATRTITMGETVLVGLFINGADTAHSTWDNVTLPLTALAGTAPEVRAHTEASMTVPVATPVQMAGWAQDDGLPIGVLQTMWRNQSGGNVSLQAGSVYDLDPHFVFNDVGSHTMRLLADDGEVRTFSDVEVIAEAVEEFAPIIDEQPESLLLPLGDRAEFTVGARGYPTPTYQWFRVGEPDTLISGATSASLVIDPVQESDEGEYYVVVTNSVGSVTSNTVSLGILYPPELPTDLTATAESHSSIALSWTAPSPPVDGYLIQQANASDGPWGTLETVSGTSYTHTGLPQLTTRFYRVRAFNAAGHSSWSNVASATTMLQLEEQYLISFGDTAYSSDGVNTWQNFRLRQTAGANSAFLAHDNVELVNSQGVSSGIHISLSSTITGNNVGQNDPGTGSFSGNPFDWFTPSEDAQRITPAFNQNGGSITYTFSGFAPTDVVDVAMVIRRDTTGRNIDLVYNPGESDEVTLLDNQDSGVSQYVTKTALTGATSYSFRLTSRTASWVGTINAMAITVSSAAGDVYPVTYHANDGAGEVPVDATHYPVDFPVTVRGSGSLVRSGYAFIGWNTQSEGGELTRYLPGNLKNMVEGGLDLYAEWVPGRVITMDLGPILLWDMDPEPVVDEAYQIIDDGEGNDRQRFAPVDQGPTHTLTPTGEGG